MLLLYLLIPLTLYLLEPLYVFLLVVAVATVSIVKSVTWGEQQGGSEEVKSQVGFDRSDRSDKGREMDYYEKKLTEGTEEVESGMGDKLLKDLDEEVEKIAMAENISDRR